MRTLPFPDNSEELRVLVDELKSYDGGSFSNRFGQSTVQRRRRLKSDVISITNEKTIGFSKKDAVLFTAYSLHRSSNQLNEACNKLWATMELAYALSPEIRNEHFECLGNEFDTRFILGTIIPSLYYSLISTMVSMLSLFGCVSLNKNDTYYNLTRIGKFNWLIYRRADYIKEKLGYSEKTSKWHLQIFRMYHGFKEKGIKLPEIDYPNGLTLKEKRDAVHYSVLGDVSVKDVAGMDVYFKS